MDPSGKLSLDLVKDVASLGQGEPGEEKKTPAMPIMKTPAMPIIGAAQGELHVLADKPEVQFPDQENPEPYAPRLIPLDSKSTKSHWSPVDITRLVLILGILALTLLCICLNNDEAMTSLIVIVSAIAGYYFRAITKPPPK